ncbi:MAG TPA: type II secretion system F family protein [Clostridia bacterium]|nr:type II secretion system F family protein [Clostridia bacterium]
MPEFVYTSKDQTGKTYSGVIDADSIDSFYHIIKDRSQYCITVKESGVPQKEIVFGSKKFNLKELSVFCRQFSTMLNSGLPVIKCLDILYQQTTNKKMRSSILGVYETVQRGESLSSAMKHQKTAFPSLFIHLVEAGEASGSLDSVMNRMAEQYEKENKLQNKVTQALIYPIFLCCLSIVVVIFLLTFVLPTFLSMFTQFGGQLPVTTKILLGISHLFTNYWYLILILLAGIYIGFRALMRKHNVRLGWDKLKLRLPIIGKLLLILESSRFARTLASLFNSGMPVMQSVEITANVMTNSYIRNRLFHVNEEVRRGSSISASIRKLNLFPLMLCSMLNIGEESGNMDVIRLKTSAFYDEEADAALQKLVSLIEPFMIVLLAVVVGFIIVSIITPIYGVYSQISKTGM